MSISMQKYYAGCCVPPAITMLARRYSPVIITPTPVERRRLKTQYRDPSSSLPEEPKPRTRYCECKRTPENRIKKRSKIILRPRTR